MNATPFQKHSEPLTDGTSVSRRQFLSGSLLGMATLVAAPQIGDTVFFPNLAYADDIAGIPFNVGAVGTQSTDVQFSVAVIRPNEVGFMLQDVANKGKGVPNAKVTITSYAVKDDSGEYKTIDATTNADGKIILKIEDLSENKNGEKDKGKYAFWGKVYIDPPANSDYRIFETGAMRFYGGKGAVAPTQAIAGKPYPSCLTMDDVDITYTLSRFVVSSKNDRPHTIMARIRGLQKGASATIKICEKGKSNAISQASGTANDQGICEVSMTEKYFQRGNKVCLSGDTEYDVIAETTDMAVTIPTQLKAITGIPTGDEMDEDASSVATFKPPISFASVDLASFVSIQIPAIKSPLNIGFPNPPVQIQINPAGFGLVGIGLPPFPLAGTDGGFSKDAWKKNSVLNIKEAFADAVVDAMNVMSLRKNSGMEKTRFLRHWYVNFRFNVVFGWYYRWYVDKEITKNPFDGFDDEFSAIFQSHQNDLALARNDGLSDSLEMTLGSDNKPYFGYANVSAGIAVGGSFNWAFMLGPFPLYVELAAFASFDVGYQFNVKLARAYPSIFEDENVEWGGTHTLGITIVPGISLTVGLGFNGMLSGGVTGGLSFPMYFGHTWESMPEPGHPNPHKVVGIMLTFKLFVQILCFTVDVTLSAVDEPHLYSNWEDEKKKSLDDAINNLSFDPTRMLGVGSGGDVLQSFKDIGRPNTPTQFKASAEIKAAENNAVDVVANNRTGLEDIIFGAYDPRLISGDFDGDVDELFSSSANAAKRTGAPNTAMFVASSANAADLLDAPDTIMFKTYRATEADINRYDAVGLENGVTGATISNRPGVKAISNNDCVVPDSDVVSFHNVYSDDRRDFIICDGRTFLLRIVTVEYHLRDGSVHYRPRLGLNEFVNGAWINSGFIDVPEFPQAWGFKRMDTYDYDFGATAFGQSIFVVLLSSLRSEPDSEKGNMDEAVQCDVYTVMTIDTSVSVPTLLDYRSMLARQLVSLDGSYTDDPTNAAKCHLLTNPVVMMLRDKKGTELYPYFSVVHRVAKTPDDLVGSEAKCSIEYGLYFKTETGGTVLMGNATKDVDPSIVNLQITQSALGSTSSLWAVHTLAFFPDPSKIEAQAVEGDDDPSVEGTGLVDCYTSYPNEDYSVSWKRNVHNASLPQMPQSWPQYGGFLIAHDDHMYQVSVDIDAENADQFIETQIDFDGFSGRLFAVDQNGDFLFFINTFEADGPLDYEHPDKPREKVTRYLIGAAKVFRDSESTDTNGYAISQVFPYAELENPIDMIGSVTVGTECTTFIASQIVDRNNNLADLRVIKVPHVIKAKATALESLNPFVQPGAGVEKGIPKEEFYLTMKNVGNTMITGFRALMLDKAGTVIDKAEITEMNIDNMELSMDDFNNSNALKIPDGQDSIQDVASNLDKLSGIAALSDAKQNGCLMPGEELVYKIEYLIPSSWDGFVEVSVDIDGYIVRGYQGVINGENGNRLAAQSDASDSQSLRNSEAQVANEGIMFLDGSSNGRFQDPTIIDISSGLMGREWLTTIDTPTDQYATARLRLANADVDLTQQAPSDVVVTKNGKNDDNGGGTVSPSTGDHTPIASAAALALGAAGVGLAAYSRRRTAIEAEARATKETNGGDDDVALT